MIRSSAQVRGLHSNTSIYGKLVGALPVTFGAVPVGSTDRTPLGASDGIPVVLFHGINDDASPLRAVHGIYDELDKPTGVP